MNCDCIKSVDAKLREKNLKLTGYAFTLPAFKPVITIQTDWLDASKAPRGMKRDAPYMFASHCPFCGTEIVTPAEE